MSLDEFEAYDFSEFTAQELAAVDAQIASLLGGGPAIELATDDSPYTRFRAWRTHLAVTDLVSPLWCEVQYEYGLYGQRHKPLSRRPSSFTSKNGKQIHVHQGAANANDITLKRGKSIHKALEQQLRPIPIDVRTTSNEERFGLRLLNLIDGFSQLLAKGITRELPVFVVTHNRVVVGVIDEVRQSRLSPDQVTRPSPPKKKQRLALSPTLQKFDPHVLTGEPTDDATLSVPYDPYELQLIDYKTRRSSNLPLDQDSLSPRLQLMMYHRMLSSLLDHETFDFDLLWNKLSIDPTRPFSTQFLDDIRWQRRQTDTTEYHLHLNRLVFEWTSFVQRLRPRLTGVSRQLQIVYRRSHAGKRQENKAAVVRSRDGPIEALILQEELDLARAIEESLGQMGYQDAAHVAGHVAQKVKQAKPPSASHPSAIWKDLASPLDAAQSDPALAWAIQQSLLTCARKTWDQIPAEGEAGAKNDDEALTGEPQAQQQADVDISTSSIMGTKTFQMNEAELDRHLVDVLQWWLGRRPARGVDIDQTHRCFTCEYEDSCEWREKKAREAVALVSDLSGSSSVASSGHFRNVNL